MRISVVIVFLLLFNRCSSYNNEALHIDISDTIYSEVCLTSGQFLLTLEDNEEIVRIVKFTDHGAQIFAEIKQDSLLKYLERIAKESLTNEQYWSLEDYTAELEPGSLPYAIFSGRVAIDIRGFLVDQSQNIILHTVFNFVSRREKETGGWQSILERRNIFLRFKTNPLSFDCAHDSIGTLTFKDGNRFSFIFSQFKESGDGYSIYGSFGSQHQHIAAINLNHKMKKIQVQPYQLYAWENDIDTSVKWARIFKICDLESNKYPYASIQQGKLMVHENISPDGLILAQRKRHPEKDYFLYFPVDICPLKTGFLSVWRQNDSAYFPERYYINWHYQEENGEWKSKLVVPQLESYVEPSFIITESKILARIQEEDYYRLVPIDFER